MKIKLFLFIVYISTQFAAFASPVETIKKEIAQAGDDERLKAKLYYDLSRYYNGIDYEKAAAAARQSLKFAFRIKDDAAIALAYISLGIIYDNSGRIDAIPLLLDSAKMYSQRTGNIKYLFAIEEIYINYYRRKANYSKAIAHCFQALKIAEEHNDDTLAHRAYNGIGVVYATMGDKKRAEASYLSGIRYAEKLKDSLALSKFYNNIGILKRDEGKYEEALNYYFKSLDISLSLRDSSDIAFLYNDIGAAYSKKGAVQKGETYLKKSIAMRERMNELNEVAYTYNYLGENYERKNDLTQAAFYIKKALATAQKINNHKQTYEAYESLSDFYARNQMFDSAYRYAKIYKRFHDSIQKLDDKKTIAELITQYETAKKEQTIREQGLKIKQRNYLLASMGVLVLLLTLLGISYYKRNQLKQKTRLQNEILHQQKITSQAVIEAEENERKRIAADLHDGIGQMMSAAKLNLNNVMNELEIADAEQRSVLDKAMYLIDESCKEVRIVSHDLMPNALLRSGLGKAIATFINKIDQTVIKINFYTEGLNEKIDKNKELVLYRVVQECVNNVIKHAKASELYISVIKDEDGISITLEDNGKGFDVKNIEKTSGIGIRNIKSRIQYLKGTIEWDSAPGRGTVVTIHT